MAIPVFTLGPFTFVNLHTPGDNAGPPLFPGERAAVIERPGVDGAGILQMGVKGEPFQMVSSVDVTTKTVALNLLALYNSHKGQKSLGLVWSDIDYESAFNTRYFVLDVMPLGVKRMPAATGGLSGSSSPYWVQAVWTLLPVPVS